MGSGLVQWVALLWSGIQEGPKLSGGQFEQLGPWGLTRDDPSWATICLSSHERAWPVVREPVQRWAGPGWAVCWDLAFRDWGCAALKPRGKGMVGRQVG